MFFVLSFSLREFYSNNVEMIGIISLVITSISVVLAILFYLKPRKKRIPSYTSKTAKIIDNAISNIDKLDIFYDNKKLSSLTLTKIAFWNKGWDTISHSDIAPNDKLRIIVSPNSNFSSDFEILSCEILTQTKVANNFTVQLAQDKQSVLLDFDYLDHNEGVVLRLRHTGLSSDSLVVSGSIKAAKDIKQVTKKAPNIWNEVIMSASAIAFGLVAGTLAVRYIIVAIFVLMLFIFAVSFFISPYRHTIPESLLKAFDSVDF